MVSSYIYLVKNLLYSVLDIVQHRSNVLALSLRRISPFSLAVHDMRLLSVRLLCAPDLLWL